MGEYHHLTLKKDNSGCFDENWGAKVEVEGPLRRHHDHQGDALESVSAQTNSSAGSQKWSGSGCVFWRLSRSAFMTDQIWHRRDRDESRPPG